MSNYVGLFDTCVWHRPFDDQSQRRVVEETIALYRLIELIEAGDLDLATSEILVLEATQSTDAEKQSVILEALTVASGT
ncbi:MAG: hypothetical protein SH850_25565 [Planctomycetaceae bacterium]|nr:hypothetical protein [Planctomycetaceae bacterium]